MNTGRDHWPSSPKQAEITQAEFAKVSDQLISHITILSLISARTSYLSKGDNTLLSTICFTRMLCARWIFVYTYLLRLTYNMTSAYNNTQLNVTQDVLHVVALFTR